MCIKSETENQLIQLTTQAKTHYTNRQYQEALENFKAVIKLSPEDYEVNWYIGQCYSNLPNIAECNQRALEAFHRSITINANYFYGQIGKGITLHKLGRNQEAVVALTKAIALHASHPLTYYYRSFAHQQIGNLKEAYDDMKKSLEIESTPDKIQKKNALESVLTNETSRQKSPKIKSKGVAKSVKPRQLKVALESIKAINEYTWKGVELIIKASSSKELQLTFKLLKSTNNVFLNSAIYIAKELAEGKDISAVISGAIPEIEKSIFKDIVVSEAVKKSAIVLGKLGSRIFGALLGEILFSNPLNPAEFENVTISVRHQINAMDNEQYTTLMNKSLEVARAKTTAAKLDAQKRKEEKAYRKSLIKQRAANENKPYSFFNETESSKQERKEFSRASERNSRNESNTKNSTNSPADIECLRCYQSSTGKLVPDLICRPWGSDQYYTFFDNVNAVKAAYPNSRINYVGPDHDLGHSIGQVTVQIGDNDRSNSNNRDSSDSSATTVGGGGNTWGNSELSNYDKYYSGWGDRI